MKKYRRLNSLWFSVLCWLMILLFLSLGVWQWHRYLFKKYQVNQYQWHQGQPSQSLFSLSGSPDLYRKVFVSGRPVSGHVVLLTNQLRQGKPGDEVFLPVEVGVNKPWLLVSRGWLPLRAGRFHSAVPVWAESRIWRGQVYFPMHAGFFLGPWRLPGAQRVVQSLRLPAIGQLLQHPIYPFVLRLESGDSACFLCEWQVVALPPVQHLSYMIQWWSLALLVLIGWFLGLRRRGDGKSK